MYIIVVGGGKVGYYLTKTLLTEDHEVLLIEREREKVDTYSERLGAVLLQGDGAEAATLAEAGAARADVVRTIWSSARWRSRNSTSDGRSPG